MLHAASDPVYAALVEAAAEGLVTRLVERPSGWLFLVGAGLSASSGVPLPERATRFSPSLRDLVRHELFRTQSRRTFERLADAADEPPLGLLADGLSEQAAWFAARVEGLGPHVPLLRAADLARAGLFSAMLTNAADRLLAAALARVGVAHQVVSLESPQSPPAGVLPVLYEWDDRIFRDTEDRRARENAFVNERLRALVEGATGVVIAGHAGADSDLVRDLLAIVAERPELPALWVCEPHERDAVEPLCTGQDGLELLAVDEVGAFLEELCVRLKTTPTPLADDEPPKASLLARAMRKSFDVRPVLVFVPGVALLGSLIDKLPRISVKMALSLVALLAAFVAYHNYGIYREYDEQIQPVKAHLASARRELQNADDPEAPLRAVRELDEAAVGAKRVVTPYTTLFSISLLHKHIDEDFESTQIDIRQLRDLEVTPLLYRHRLRARLSSDPAQLSLGRHPPILVRRGALGDDADPRALFVDGVPFESWRVPEPLAQSATERRVAVWAEDAALVRALVHEAMIAELDAGRVPIAVRLGRSEISLDELIASEVRTVAGYVGERAADFSPDGITTALRAGRASLFVLDAEASGLSPNLRRVRDFMTRYPESRCTLALSGEDARQQMADQAPEFALLTVERLRWGQALAYLREHTSDDFVRGMMQDDELRTRIGDPLVASLLVDYHHFAGRAPRSLAQIYDRLLQHMTSGGTFGGAPKLRVLPDLAWAEHEGGGHIARETAVRVVSDDVFKKGDLDKAAALLEELVGDGVLRHRHDGGLAFAQPELRRLSLAKALAERPLSERVPLLLSYPDEELVAFHAGLFPDVDELVRAMLADYRGFEATVAHDAGGARPNPYVVVLRRAALAVRNGEPSAAVRDLVESTALGLVDHPLGDVVDTAFGAMQALSSARVRRFVVDGLASHGARDVDLLAFAARASEELYVSPVVAWLATVATDADPRRVSRYDWMLRLGPDGEPLPPERDRVASETALGVRRALETLAQVGSPAALAALQRFVAPASDPRFDAEAWAEMRRAGLLALLRTGHAAEARRFLPEIEASPQLWASVLAELRWLDDADTAALLARLVDRPDPWSREVGAYKDRAALALAAQGRARAEAALAPLLERAPRAEHDYQAYAALALGYRGDPRDFATVEGLVRRALAGVAALRPTRENEDTLGVLRRAVALFGSSAALALYEEIERSDGWRALDGQTAHELAHFRGAPGAEAVLAALLCRSKPEEEGPLLGALARQHTQASTRAFDSLLGLYDGVDDVAGLAALCSGDAAGAEARLARWRQAGPLALLLALATDHLPHELPRFASWALDADPAVREGAVRALGRYDDPAAVHALMENLRRFDERDDAVRALGATASPLAEGPLVAAWPDDKTRALVVDELGRVGGATALPLLYGAVDDPKLRTRAGAAILAIARRLRGRLPLSDALAAAAPPPRKGR